MVMVENINIMIGLRNNSRFNGNNHNNHNNNNNNHNHNHSNNNYSSISNIHDIYPSSEAPAEYV